MTSPNEPGQRPGTGDGSADLPPWQRTRTEARPTESVAASAQRPTETFARVTPGAGIPASRYLTGVAAPDLSGLDQRTANPPAPSVAVERTEVITGAANTATMVEAYPSELPDLSGPAHRPTSHRRQTDEPARPAGSPESTPRIQVGRPRGPIRASMQIRRIDPWSALKVSALLSGALFFIWMIAVAFLYLVLGAMGVWTKLNSNVGDLLTSGSGGGGDLVSASSIFGGAALVGLVNIVLLTAMATIGAYIYNLSTDIVGGVEVTLADLD